MCYKSCQQISKDANSFQKLSIVAQKSWANGTPTIRDWLLSCGAAKKQNYGTPEPTTHKARLVNDGGPGLDDGGRGDEGGGVVEGGPDHQAGVQQHGGEGGEGGEGGHHLPGGGEGVEGRGGKGGHGHGRGQPARGDDGGAGGRRLPPRPQHLGVETFHPLRGFLCGT